MVLAPGDDLRIGRDGLRADVDAHHIRGERSAVHDPGFRGRVDGRRQDVVQRQEEVHLLFGGLGQDLQGDVLLVVLDERPAHVLALGLEERVGHRSPDEDVVGLVQEVLDDRDLVLDLGAAEDGHVGLGRRMDGLAEVIHLFLEEVSGGLDRDELRDGLDRGVGAVAGAERVVDVDVDALGQLFGEGLVVVRLALGEAQVLEDEHLSLPELLLEPGDLGSDDVGGLGHLVRDELGETGRGRLEAHLRVRLALGSAEVGSDDELRPAVEKIRDGGQGGPDARVVTDLALLGQRDVEVHPEKDQFALDVQLFDGSHGRPTSR